MPLRNLLRMLAQNEQLIQKLSESYPIRRAAQLSAYFFQQGKAMGEEKLEDLKKESETQSKRLGSFSKTFKDEIVKGIEEMKEKQKRL